MIPQKTKNMSPMLSRLTKPKEGVNRKGTVNHATKLEKKGAKNQADF